MLSSGNFRYFFLICAIVSTLNEVIFVTEAKIPDDIKLCKKDDPRLNDCLKNLFESLRPKLVQGIPEIELPPLDPLVLKELVVLPGGRGQMRAIGHNIKVTGVSNIQINHLKANVEKLEIDVGVFFPFLKFEGSYDVDAKFANLAVKGKGPLRGNASEITGNALLKGKFVEINGEKFVQFTNIDVDVDVKDYNVRVDKLFPDRNLNDAINALLNDKKLHSVSSAKPIINKLASKMLLDVINKIAMKLSFDEVFE